MPESCRPVPNIGHKCQAQALPFSQSVQANCAFISCFVLLSNCLDKFITKLQGGQIRALCFLSLNSIPAQILNQPRFHIQAQQKVGWARIALWLAWPMSTPTV